MRSPWVKISIRGRCAAAALAWFASGWLFLSTPIAFAQDAAPPPGAAPPTQTAPAERQGLFQSIGRWLDQGAANFRDHLRGAKERMDNLGDDAAASRKNFGEKATEVGKSAAEATKSAVDAVVKLPTARVMSGHERCEIAPNGAPDCVAAAEALCRKHGFATGTSMDFTSAEQCPARVLLSSQQSRIGCTTVTFISRAMCQ
jgi:hypothetical protein